VWGVMSMRLTKLSLLWRLVTVVRQEHDSGLAELKKVLNDHGIRARLSVRIRRK
jgi:hypothetical protein